MTRRAPAPPFWEVPLSRYRSSVSEEEADRQAAHATVLAACKKPGSGHGSDCSPRSLDEWDQGRQLRPRRFAHTRAGSRGAARTRAEGDSGIRPEQRARVRSRRVAEEKQEPGNPDSRLGGHRLSGIRDSLAPLLPVRVFPKAPTLAVKCQYPGGEGHRAAGGRYRWRGERAGRAGRHTTQVPLGAAGRRGPAFPLPSTFECYNKHAISFLIFFFPFKHGFTR